MDDQAQQPNKLVEDWAAAELRGDTAFLERTLAEDFVGVGPRGFMLTKDQWLARHEAGNLKYGSFGLHEVQVRSYGDAAVVVCRETAEGVYEDENGRYDINEQFRATLIFIGQQERWLLASLQLSPIQAVSLPPRTSAKTTSETVGGSDDHPTRDVIRGGLAMTAQRNLWALSGVLFAVFFIVSLVLGGLLSSGAFPLPGAPVGEVANYFTENRNAVLVSGLLQALSAASLLVFVAPVATFARRIAGERRALVGLTSGGGALAAVFLLLSALLSWVLALTAAELGLELVGTLRSLNFLSGGAAHVASLGLFVGATSIAASRARALPRWILWLGTLAAVLSILSLASLVWFPASILLPLGRLLSLVWSIAVGLVLVLGKQREPVAGL